MSYCDACGRKAPTEHVELMQNIGALVIRFRKSIEGDLCKDCINKYFKSLTLTTLFLGWWGVISFVVTPFIILNNLYVFIHTRSLVSPPSFENHIRNSEIFIEIQKFLEGGAPVQVVVDELVRNGLNKEVAYRLIYEATNRSLAKCNSCEALFAGSLEYCSICGSRMELVRI